MQKTNPPKIITANDLITGDVVYLAAAGNWVRRHQDAVLFIEATSANQQLETAKMHAALVVGAYLIDAETGPHGALPIHFREVFRATGPSNYTHGKQAEQAYVSVQ